MPSNLFFIVPTADLSDEVFAHAVEEVGGTLRKSWSGEQTIVKLPLSVTEVPPALKPYPPHTHDEILEALQEHTWKDPANVTLLDRLRHLLGF